MPISLLLSAIGTTKLSSMSFLVLNIDKSLSPSIPNQFSALWIWIRSWINSSSVLPPKSPPFPFSGPKTLWLYKGSFTIGYPERKTPLKSGYYPLSICYAIIKSAWNESTNRQGFLIEIWLIISVNLNIHTVQMKERGWTYRWSNEKYPLSFSFLFAIWSKTDRTDRICFWGRYNSDISYNPCLQSLIVALSQP